MSTRRRIVRWLIGLIGFVVLLLVIGALFAPKLIKMEAVNEYLEDQLSQEIDGHVDFRRINLSWFPRPHADVQDVTFSLSADVDGKMTALRIYPKIVPLIWGGFELSRLSAIEPEYNMKISETLTPDASGQQDLAISNALQDLHDLLLAFPGFTVSGLNVKIKDGSVRIFDGDKRVFGFHDLQASYSRPENETKFDLTCKSNLWNDISINGRLDAEKFSGHGTIRFAEFRPHALSNYFFPDSPLKITEALANLTIDFELNGPDWARANLNGSVPYIKITNDHSSLDFSDILINGTVGVTENETRFSVEKLSMLQPRINLAGKLIFGQEKPLVSLEVEGRDFEIESIRQLALETGGKNKILQTVLNVVRGGEVPKVTLSSKGEQLEDLIKMKNILIRGEMVDGNIFIPEINLDLRQVSGTVVILDGLLQGYSLKSQMGGSLGKNGRLTLGLNKHISPFHLDILIHADLTQLPPILKRVVKHENFLKELARIKPVNGEALGKLTIDYDKKKVGVKVEASEVQLEADYERIPFPVKISGGPFYFDLHQVGFSNFDVAIGKSTFAHVTSTLKWQKSTRLTFASESATVHMHEIFPWLKSLGTIPKELQDIRAVDGLVHIDRVTLAGPLLGPEKWKIQSRGKFEQVSIQSQKLFKPLRIVRGRFVSQDTRFGITDVDASVGKSSLSGITGGIDWGDTKALTIVSGSSRLNVKELYDWLIKLDNTREYIRNIPDIDGTLALKSLKLDTPLQSPKIQQIRFSAEFNTSNLNSNHFPGQLQIDRGNISLAHERLLLADCSGAFGKSTFSQLAIDWDWGAARSLQANSSSVVMSADEIWPWLLRLQKLDTGPGTITVSDGRVVLNNLELLISLNKTEPWRISANGDLQNVIATADFMDQPMTLAGAKFIITQGDLTGVSHNVVKLESSLINWGESRIIFVGDIYLAPDKPFVDMNISMNSIKWARIEKIIDSSSDPKEESQKPSEPFITADLRISADIFEYGNFTFQPLQTNVSLKPEEVMVTIEKADLCDITINGFIKITDQSTEYYFIPAAHDKTLEKTLACLSKEKASASGTYILDGEVMAKATPQATARIYSGKLDFNANKGRIYRFGLLAKLFAILNVTEIYRGEGLDLLGKGFAYESMTIKANLEGKKLVMEECYIDGASMGIACDGEIDLAEDKINLVILVAPFKTVDRIVKKIPLVSNVLGGKLVSIPFRAIGDLEDPAVIPLEPTAVGSGVLGVLERTLKLPITLMQPLMDDEKEDKPKGENDQQVKPEPSVP